MKKGFEKLRELLYNTINDCEFKEYYRMSEKSFNRNRKLPFSTVMLMILSGMKKGLKAGISTFFEETNNEIRECSATAFSKARQNISPEAFKELFYLERDFFYNEEKYKTFKGYRICAIDGSDINLPKTEKVLEEFGSQKYTNGKVQPQALCSCLYDVMNHVVLDAHLEKFNSNERELALSHLEYIKSCTVNKNIVLMDRGYPSCELIYAFNNSNTKFIARVDRNSFFKELRTAKRPDDVIYHTQKGITVNVRVLSLQFESTEITLLTNIMDNEFSIDDFKVLYKMRWLIENYYDDLKNKLQLENFSGVNPICIYQDFYATMILSNMIAYYELYCNDELERIKNNTKRLYEYQINRANMIRITRETVIQMLAEASPRKAKKLLKKIEKQILCALLPIRDGRSFPRSNHHSPNASRFSFNSKNF